MTKNKANINAALNGGRGSGQTARRISKIYEDKIADLKANFDYVLEGKDLEIKLLGERCNQLLKDKGNLTDELQELKETFGQTIENDEVAYETLKLHDQEEIGMLNSKVTELENKIADIKANCDLAIEGRDIKIMELEKENAELKKKLKEKLKTIADKDLSFVAKFDALEKENAELEKENAELKDDNKVMADNYSKMEQKFYNNLTKAKDILKYVLNSFVGDLPRNLGYFDEEELKAIAVAEQFLQEIEK